jgi:hypothetical protein
MAEYTYSSSYTTSSPGRPYTPPHSVFLAALMSLSAGEMSSDSTSGRTSRGSGLHSPNLSSVPRSVRYNPISVPAVTRPGRERKRRSSKHDDFSDDDDDFAPAAPLLPRTRCKLFIRYKEYKSFLIVALQSPRGNSSLTYRVGATETR